MMSLQQTVSKINVLRDPIQDEQRLEEWQARDKKWRQQHGSPDRIAGIRFSAAHLFLREEKTTVGKKLCIIFRVSKDDWKKSHEHEVTELVWIPAKRQGVIRCVPVFLTRSGATWNSMPAGDVLMFLAPRRLPWSESAILTPYWLARVVRGECFCCGHDVHPKFAAQNAVLKALEPMIENNRAYKSEKGLYPHE